MVTDEPLEVSAPQYSPKDVRRLADAIEGTILRRGDPDRDVELLSVGGPFKLARSRRTYWTRS